MSSTLTRHLRRRLFNEGWQPPADALPQAVAASWQRCVQNGLDPYSKKIPENILPAHILRIRQEQRQELIETVAPSMDYLRSLISDSSSVIVLADAQGVIIHSVGDTGFMSKADSVLLKPGASWKELHRGTNAIGTALVESRPICINGSEHYFDKHGFLTCAAAPIHDAQGKVIGVLDISSEHQRHHPHTLGLVKATVDQVEKQWLFKEKPAAAIVATLHPQAYALGTLAEGVLFLDETGLILGGNSAAALWLGMHAVRPEQLRLQQILNLHWDGLLGQSKHQSIQQFLCSSFSGASYHVRLDFSDFRAHTTRGHSGSEPAAPPVDLREKARSTVESTLQQCAGNVSQAAKMLGISRTTLYRYLRGQA